MPDSDQTRIPSSPVSEAKPIPDSSTSLNWVQSLLLLGAALLGLVIAILGSQRIGLPEPVILLVPAAIAVLGIFTLWPTVALVLWVLSAGLVPIPLIGGEVYLHDLFTALLLGLWFIQLLRTGRLQISGPDRAVLIVALAAVISIVLNGYRAPEVAERFFRLKHFHLDFLGKPNLAAIVLWLIYFLAYFYSSRLCSSYRKIAWILVALLVMVLCNTLYALYFWATDPLGFSRMNRTIGLMQEIQDQGYLCAMILIGIIVALLLGVFRGWKRWLLIGIGVLLLLNLLFNFTRAVYVEFAFGLMLLFLILRSFRVLIIPLLIGLLIVGILSMVNIDREALDKITHIGSSKAQGVSLRTVTWLDAIRISKEEGKFWGVGLGNYMVYSDAVIFPAQAHRKRLASAHSMYLQILAEQGVPGLLAWLGFFIIMIRFFYRHYRKADEIRLRAMNLWILILLAMYVLDGMVYMVLLPPGHSHEAVTAGYFIWILLGLGVAANRLGENQLPLSETS